jgi:hypothetical protein
VVAKEFKSIIVSGLAELDYEEGAQKVSDELNAVVNEGWEFLAQSALDYEGTFDAVLITLSRSTS